MRTVGEEREVEKKESEKEGVGEQEGSPPPLACTAEVGFFYIDMCTRRRAARTCAHAHARARGG